MMDSEPDLECFQDTINEFKCDTISEYCAKYSRSECKLKCLYVNARSMKGNTFDDITLLARRADKIDVLIIAETWLNKDDSNDYYNIDGFSQFQIQRDTRGGGLALYIKESWESKPIKTVNKEHSIMAVNIRKGKESYDIIGVYSPHISNACDFIEDLDLVLNYIKEGNVVLVGDTNINTLVRTCIGDNYRNCLDSYCLQQCNKIYPTRKTDNSETLIDHVAIRGDNKHFSIFNITSDISDHYVLILEVNGSYEAITGESKVGREIVQINYKKLRKFLRFNDNFDDVQEDLDKYVSSLVERVKDGVQMSMATKKSKNIRCKPIKGWATSEFLELVDKKEIAYSKTKVNFPSSNVKEEYKAL